MKSDLYLKIVLSVIAAALVMLVLQNMGIGLVAQVHATAQKSTTTGVAEPNKTTIDVNIVSLNGQPLQGGALPVIGPAGYPIDINIASIAHHTSIWQEGSYWSGLRVYSKDW